MELPANVVPRREFGQNFLTDIRILRREIEYAQIGPTDTILEIGAAFGNLTEFLAETGARVVAIEADRQFEARLESLQRAYPNLEVRWGDALQVVFPRFNKAVANLPYRIALPIIFKLLEHQFQTAVLVVQARLARRLCADPGEPAYGRVSVTMRRVASLQYLETINKDAFVPSPDVDSAIVRICQTRPRFAVPSNESFKRLLDFLFLRRDSSLRSVVRFLPADQSGAAVRAIPHDLQNRIIASLAPENFGRVARAFDHAGVVIPPVSNEIKRKAQKYL